MGRFSVGFLCAAIFLTTIGCHGQSYDADQGISSDLDMAAGSDSDMMSTDAGGGGGDMAQHIPVFSFGAAQPIMTTYANANALWSGDFNADGKTDLFIFSYSPIISTGDGIVDAVTGNGDGSFAYDATHNIVVRAGGVFTVADVNNDTKMDGIYYYTSTNPITHVTSYFFGYATSNGDGTFTNGSFGAPTSMGIGLYAGDLNNDHAVEVLTVSEDNTANPTGFSIFVNDGSNAMTRANYLAPTYPAPVTALVVRDLTADGKQDVFYAAQKQAVLVAGSGNGTVAAMPMLLDTGLGNNLSVVVADLNADTRPDLVVGQDNGSVTVFLALAAGGFGAGNPYTGMGSANAIAAGDFDNDGLPDVVTCDLSNLTFLLNSGNGFKPPIQIAQPCRMLVTGDFNGDKLADIALATGGGAFVMLNTTH